MVYKKKDLPKRGDAVLAKVKKVVPHSFFAVLEEYENVEAIVHISEVASSWVKNIRNYAKEGQLHVLKVIDTKENQVVASLKRINSGERKKKLQEWKLNSKIEKLFDVYARSKKLDPKDVYEELGNEIIEVFGSFYNFYESIKEYGDEVLKEIKSKHKKDFLELVKTHIKEKEIIVKKEIEMNTKESNGVDIIKDAFKKYLSKAKVTVISTPKYSVELKSKSYKEGAKKLQEMLDKLEEECRLKNINFEVVD